MLAPLLIALAGCGAEPASDGSAPAQDTEAIEVRVAEASGQEVPRTLELDGTLLADQDSNLTSLVPGRVVEVLVERGDRVQEGQPLVRLRDVDFRLQAAAARAQYDQAQARLGIEEGGSVPAPEETTDVQAAASNLELAEANLQRAEELGRRGVLSEQSLDQVRAAADAARQRHAAALNGARSAIAALRGARASLSQASTAANDATIRAPFAGEIAERMVSVGEYVSPQSPLVTLVSTDPLRMEMSVPQQRVLDVRPGLGVEVRVDAAPDRVFEGTVRYVSASVARDTRGLTVEAVVPNPDGLLRPGLFANARLSTGGTREVAVVPPEAVLSRAGVHRAFVVSDGRVEERVVTISDGPDGSVVIEDGVSAGETVAIERLDQLSDGSTVRVGGAALAADEAN